MSFALKEVFNNDEPMIQERMHVLWEHSAQIVAICFVLAREIKGMQPEEALLIGLVHDVGAIAILNYIHKFPELAENETALEEARRRGSKDAEARFGSPRPPPGRRQSKGQDHETPNLRIPRRVQLRTI